MSNILNCITKICYFEFRNQRFRVDLKEGDLHDSWNGICLSDGSIKDFNFSWQYPDCAPSIWLYKVNPDNSTDHSEYDIINFDKLIGTAEDYFNLTKSTE